MSAVFSDQQRRFFMLYCYNDPCWYLDNHFTPRLDRSLKKDICILPGVVSAAVDLTRCMIVVKVDRNITLIRRHIQRQYTDLGIINSNDIEVLRWRDE
jgi:hypothetical protein